jgi:hypothetical protein
MCMRKSVSSLRALARFGCLRQLRGGALEAAYAHGKLLHDLHLGWLHPLSVRRVVGGSVRFDCRELGGFVCVRLCLFYHYLFTVRVVVFCIWLLDMGHLLRQERDVCVS